MMAEKQKLNEIFLLTTFFCFFVVFGHLTSVPITTLTVGTRDYLLFFVCHKFVHFAVPGFLFLSGLKLSYSYQKKTFVFRDFAKKRILKVFFPYLFWYVIYYILFRNLNFMEHKTLIEHITAFFLGTIAAPFYFVILIFQFYALFGVILWLLRRFSHTGILWKTAVFQIFYFHWSSSPYSDRFFANYLIYFILGCIVAFHLEKWREYLTKYKVILCITFLLLFVWHIGNSYYSTKTGAFYPFWHVSECLYNLSAIITFYWFCYFLCQFLPNICIALFRWLDAASFGVYLCHSYILYLCNEKWAQMGIDDVLQRFQYNTEIVLSVAFLGTILWILLRKKTLSVLFQWNNV